MTWGGHRVQGAPILPAEMAIEPCTRKVHIGRWTVLRRVIAGESQRTGNRAMI